MTNYLNHREQEQLITVLNKFQDTLLGYMKPSDIIRINDAIRFITKAYRYYSIISQRLHLVDIIESAQVLAEMAFGPNIIIGTLLKDVLNIEDQLESLKFAPDLPDFNPKSSLSPILNQIKIDWSMEYQEFVQKYCNYQFIKSNFGPEFADIAGLSAKINIIEHRKIDHSLNKKAQQFFLSLSQGQEVLIIKLVEKIQLLSIINTITDNDKKQKIAQYMLEVYAPLAGRFGLGKFKEILEDGGFAILYPGLRESLLQRIAYLNEIPKSINDSDTISAFMINIYNSITMNGISAIVDGREKEVYSIWKKMVDKKIKFEKLSDIFAARIVTDTVANCYKALGIIHSTFSAVEGKFKDYISSPKANGYKSIHTVVLGPNLYPIEIQIRTEQMHREAEFGNAAHWLYKQVDTTRSELTSTVGSKRKSKQEPETIVTNQAQSISAIDSNENDIFCFSPVGDIINLPPGSTALDFAFHIHSCIGITAFKAKINHQIKPLHSKLKNGDQVEIMCKSYPTVNQDWLNVITSDRAKNSIKKYIKESSRNEFETIGRQVLISQLGTVGMNYSKKIIKKILPYFGNISICELLNGLGHGTIDHENVIQKIRKHYDQAPVIQSAKAINLIKNYKKDVVNFADNEGGIFANLIQNMAIHRNHCCYPLPGEKIMGIFIDNNGIEIHKVECLHAKIEDPNRLAFEMQWSGDGHECYHAGIRILIAHKINSLAIIASIIGQKLVNIVNFHIITQSIDFYEAIIEIEVKGYSHLEDVIVALSATDVACMVERI